MGTKLKQPRRFAIILTLVFLGIVAWLGVMLLSRSVKELKLSRMLGSGTLLCRMPAPARTGDGWVQFGRANYTVWLNGKRIDPPRMINRRMITVSPSSNPEVEIWRLKLDPLDKSWELRIQEERPILLCFGEFEIRLGTRRTLWVTHRN